MTAESRHVSVRIDRPAADVYEYVANPANLPEWAHGLGTSVENVNGEWFMETGSGRVRVRFAERNSFGVLDHDVSFPSGDVVHVSMRVIPDGDTSEVVFTVRGQPGMTDAELDRDASLVQADLRRIKHIVEAGG